MFELESTKRRDNLWRS